MIYYMFDFDFDCTYKDVENKYINNNELSIKKQDSLEIREQKEENKLNEPMELEDSIDLDDVAFLCEEIYRTEFLKFFKLTEYDDLKVNEMVHKLFCTCIADELFSKLIEALQTKIHAFSDDTECAFMQLFSYPLFHLTHGCIKQLILTGTITQSSYSSLEEEINSSIV